MGTVLLAQCFYHCAKQLGHYSTVHLAHCFFFLSDLCVYSQKISTTKEKNSADVSAASARFSIFGSKVAKIVGRRCWNLRVPDPDPARSVIPHQSQHHRLEHHHQDQELNENQKLFIIVKYGRKVNKHSNICSLLVIIVLKTNRMIMKTMILMIFYYIP